MSLVPVADISVREISVTIVRGTRKTPRHRALRVMIHRWVIGRAAQQKPRASAAGVTRFRSARHCL